MNPDYGIQKAIGHLQKAHECLNKIDTTRVSFGGKKLQINLTKEQEAALRAQLEIKP